jgi:hypothetical protein
MTAEGTVYSGIQNCHNQGLQVCPVIAGLPCHSKTAEQVYRASLPGKSAGQVCRASLPGKSAGQVCRATTTTTTITKTTKTTTTTSSTSRKFCL